MSLLDDPRTYELDRSCMASHIANLPEQCRKAWAEARSLQLPTDYSRVSKIVVLGMGGSAIGSDLVRALLLDRSPVPILSHRDYGLPRSVDKDTLLVASSYSGATEEVLDGFQQSLRLDCKKVVLTTGGKLLDLARASGVPAFVFSYQSQPRAAVGYSVMPLLAVCQEIGAVPDLASEVQDAVSVLERACAQQLPDVPASRNQAKSIALRLHGKLPEIYGAGLLGPVAYRWKTQINENAKSWAVSETFPELCHNSVAGYGLPDIARRESLVVLLGAPTVHPRHKDRLVVVKELLAKSQVGYIEAGAVGHTPLAQMMSLVLLGDWTSYYLAALNGIDPTPIPSIDYLKQRLSQI
ncbi:MAG: bifunctional phosphoglucose/phosphomannose isomerase [Chloroflexi bacterium]|nr:bifunctional phosphoglucose/phosphomannose isomerase [Chloroflexota bacterium]